jgi:hypothetical protein
VLATFDRPIVADYVPAARPPWLLVAVLVGLIALALPRDLLPVAAGVSAAVVAATALVNWAWTRFASTKAEPAPDQMDDTTSDEPRRIAA